MKTIAAILLATCVVQPAAARPVHYIGAGSTATCGKWLNYRQTGTADGVGNWVLGYLSGAADWTDTLDPLNGLDSDAVLFWLDNYCSSHPLEYLTTALGAFVRQHPN
ncbi:MAG: hypothetical protein E5V41_16595 [Mesorhizobium sp.]|nr:MAG: hypothetical protein E5V41_16595 [Mesorhizobium sp.]